MNQTLIALGIALRLTVLLFVGAWLLGALAGEQGVPARGEPPPAQGHVIVTGNGRRVRIDAGVAEGDTATELALRDEEGSILMSLQIFKNDRVGYCPDGDRPGSMGFRTPDGTVDFSVRNGRGRCSILRGADGKVVLETRSARGVFREFLVDPEEGFVSVPPSAAVR